jgi:gamma-glutamyltranspeptidase/glutathione hydrolase
MAQSGSPQPKEGDLFKQPELAATLRAIAEQGSKYMYTGAWAKEFVRIVQREGGKVTPEDLKRYQPIWSEPYHEEFLGHIVYVNGPPHYGAYDLFGGLNLIETMGLERKGPYFSDVDAFQSLTRIADIVSGAPVLNARVANSLKAQSIDVSPANQLTKAYAAQVAPLIDSLYAPPADAGPHHSNAIVVIDEQGNIAAVTHTINAVIWGDTGIVVGGIPIPDSAAFQQTRLSALKAGERLPHEIIDVIAFKDQRPVLATASIGSSLVPESLRVLLGFLGQHQDLPTLMAAPPLMANLDFGNVDQAPAQRPVSVVAGAYPAEFVAQLKARKLPVTEVPAATAAGLRGTLAAVAIDESGTRSAIDQPGVLVFNGAQ